MTSPANNGASLTAADSVGPGTTVPFTTSVCKRHGQAVVVTGFAGTGTAQVHLELSMDGDNWFLPRDGGTLIVSGNGTFYQRTEDDYPALYARGNLWRIDPGVSAIVVNSIIASE